MHLFLVSSPLWNPFAGLIIWKGTEPPLVIPRFLLESTDLENWLTPYVISTGKAQKNPLPWQGGSSQLSTDSNQTTYGWQRGTSETAHLFKGFH